MHVRDKSFFIWNHITSSPWADSETHRHASCFSLPRDRAAVNSQWVDRRLAAAFHIYLCINLRLTPLLGYRPSARDLSHWLSFLSVARCILFSWCLPLDSSIWCFSASLFSSSQLKDVVGLWTEETFSPRTKFSFCSLVVVSVTMCFYGVKLLAPTWRASVLFFCWPLPQNLPDLVEPARGMTPTDIAFRVMEAHKPPHRG